MKSKPHRGIAVVTGAAGGLGASFAQKLAQQGYDLLLVDRRQAPLEQVCAGIEQRHGVSAEPYATNLCNRAEVECLADRLHEIPDLAVLVNNAGFGTAEYFVDTDVNYLVGMVDLHVVAPTLLTRAVLPGMVERDSGAVINVSSLSAWFQSAGNTQYSSTKNYLAMFSTALGEELRGTNVRVQALCPGFIRTEFHAAECMKGFHARCNPAARMWMSPDDVVDCSLRALAGKRVIVIPGLGYRILGRLAQMPLLQPLMRRITRMPRVAPTRAPAPAPADACPVAPLSIAE